MIVEEIRDRYLGKVDAIFHDGDSELRPDSPLWEGIHVVKGNMDFYAGYPERLVTQLGPTKIIQTHGHLFDINFNFQKLDYWAREEDADICLYGHLHVPSAWMEGKTSFSIQAPSANHEEPSGNAFMPVWRLMTAIFKVDFLTRDHEVYPGLSKEFAR